MNQMGGIVRKLARQKTVVCALGVVRRKLALCPADRSFQGLAHDRVVGSIYPSDDIQQSWQTSD